MIGYSEAITFVSLCVALFMAVIAFMNRRSSTNKEHAETIAATTRTQESIMELKEVVIEVRKDIKDLAVKDHNIDLKLRDIENDIKELERRVAIIEGRGDR